MACAQRATVNAQLLEHDRDGIFFTQIGRYTAANPGDVAAITDVRAQLIPIRLPSSF